MKKANTGPEAAVKCWLLQHVLNDAGRQTESDWRFTTVIHKLACTFMDTEIKCDAISVLTYKASTIKSTKRNCNALKKMYCLQ